jgi:hypothetical protein
LRVKPPGTNERAGMLILVRIVRDSNIYNGSRIRVLLMILEAEYKEERYLYGSI